MKFKYDRNEALYNLLMTRFIWYVEKDYVTMVSVDIPLLGGDRVFVSTFNESEETILLISLKSFNYEKLEEFGLTKHLTTFYDGYVAPKPLRGYDFSLRIDLKNIPTDYEDLAHRIACIRIESFAPFINHFFTVQKNFQNLEPDTPMFDSVDVMTNVAVMVEAKENCVSMTFAITYGTNFEVAIAKIFLEEFSHITLNCPAFRVRSFYELPAALSKKSDITDDGPDIHYFVVDFRPCRSQSIAQRMAVELIISITGFMESEIARLKSSILQSIRNFRDKCVKSMNRLYWEIENPFLVDPQPEFCDTGSEGFHI